MQLWSAAATGPAVLNWHTVAIVAECGAAVILSAIDIQDGVQDVQEMHQVEDFLDRTLVEPVGFGYGSASTEVSSPWSSRVKVSSTVSPSCRRT